MKHQETSYEKAEDWIVSVPCYLAILSLLITYLHLSGDGEYILSLLSKLI